jgi:hypothetical protein
LHPIPDTDIVNNTDDGADQAQEEDDDEDLPMHNPNHAGLPPLEENASNLNSDFIPRDPSTIPDHTAYSKLDTSNTGMHTSGFLPVTVPYLNCGSFREDQCVICKAFHWKAERLKEDVTQPNNHIAYPLCCQSGRVMRPALPPCPPLFKTLLTGQGLTPAQSREFKENIRRLNSHISFASLTTTKEVMPTGRGPYVYKVEGQMVRRLSTAKARTGQPPQFSQIYFHDPADARRAVEQHPNVQGLSAWLTVKMMEIYKYIRINNPYALSYKMLKDVEEDLQENNQPVPELLLIFNNRKDSSHRTYTAVNEYANSEVSVIINGTMTDAFNSRSIAVCLKDRADGADSWNYLNVNNPMVESLTYIMLFPLGTEGWFLKDNPWHSSIERVFPPPRVLKRRARATRAHLQFIDEEAIDDDAPPPLIRVMRSMSL